MKHKLFTIAALAASALVISCQQEENGPAQLEIVKTEELSLVLGDAPNSKVTVDGTTGEIAWNNGTDKIAVYVQGTGANEFQEKTVTDDAISVPLASGQSRAYFAVYPAASAVTGKYGGTGDHYLAVQYPTSYDLTGKTVEEIETFSPVPMVADNTGSDALTFYHVGGLLRLSVAQTPATTTEMVVTFTGANVTGNYAVTAGGTASATLAAAGSQGNVVTYTMNALTSPQTVTLNVPIPQGSYTGLTAIRVDAKAGSTTLASYTYSVTPAWASVTRALGRKEALSFADATLEITSDPATLWLNGTATYTASSGGSTVTWRSSATGVATVDSSTGEITPVAAGEADIIASINGGAKSVSKKVYVNSVSVVSLAPVTAKVNPTGTTPLTATLTHSNNGTITSYPSVNFSSGGISYVRINTSSGTGSVAVTPVSATETTATATANAYGYAEGGPVTVTVTVPAAVSSTGSALTATSSVTCEDITTISVPSEDYKYLFRGYYMAPGFLQYESSTYSLTPAGGALGHPELDGLASVLAAYGTAAGRTKRYFDYNTLAALPNGLGGTVYNDGSYDWRIPSSSEWNAIWSNPPSSTITVTSSAGTSTPTKGVAKIVVNLDGSALDNQGLTTSSMDSAGDAIADGAVISRTDYIAGLLLIPDGATITCSRLNGTLGNLSTNWTMSTNCITYDDLKILVTGGCIFLPTTGRFNNVYVNNKWNDGGKSGWFQASNTNSGSASNRASIGNGGCSYDSYQYKTDYVTVRLIRTKPTP